MKKSGNSRYRPLRHHCHRLLQHNKAAGDGILHHQRRPFVDENCTREERQSYTLTE